jgi:hypothetical protein
VTTLRAHNDRAASAHREDGGGDRDGFDGDPQVRAMRAVWLTMRDEDPPERGLAALLAAARVTAETMHARPTPWQRLVADLRRPPTLALATVMVLVGGAVLLGRRGVDVPAARPDAAGVVTLEPAPPETQAPSRPDIAAGTAVPGELAMQPGAADERPVAAEGSAKDERPAAGGAPVATDLKHTDVGAANAVAPPTPRGPAGPAPGAPTAGSTWNAAGPREPRPPPTREQPRSSDDLDGAASAASNVAPPPDDAVEATKKAATKKAARVEPTITRHDKQQAAPAVSLDQLYKQCEAAARRGDCATVRWLVGRITGSAPSYRTRVAKDSVVAKCLAE